MAHCVYVCMCVCEEETLRLLRNLVRVFFIALATVVALQFRTERMNLPKLYGILLASVWQETAMWQWNGM